NDTEYGLVAYLYTKDLSRGMRVSEKLDFGMVGLNRGLVSDPAAPFGGTKQSGLGREGAHEGMMEFMETQYVSGSWEKVRHPEVAAQRPSKDAGRRPSRLASLAPQGDGLRVRESEWTS